VGCYTRKLNPPPAVFLSSNTLSDDVLNFQETKIYKDSRQAKTEIHVKATGDTFTKNETEQGYYMGRPENLVWVVKTPDNEQMFKLLQLLYDNIVDSQQQLAKCSQTVRFFSSITHCIPGIVSTVVGVDDEAVVMPYKAISHLSRIKATAFQRRQQFSSAIQQSNHKRNNKH